MLVAVLVVVKLVRVTVDVPVAVVDVAEVVSVVEV
jgi:hypothetical protein